MSRPRAILPILVTALILFLCPITLGTGPCISLAFGQVPRVGTWNSYLSHLSFVECANPTDTDFQVKLSLFSDANSPLAQIPMALPAYSTRHLDITPRVPREAYGSFRVGDLDQVGASDKVVCSSITYRSAPANSHRSVDYVYSLPYAQPQSGITSVTFNSYRPDASPGVVWNFLSFVNPGDVPFSGTVFIYRQDGSTVPGNSFRITSLLPGQRRDFGIGHEQGQVVGLLQIVPDNESQAYHAFLTRYSPRPGNRFSFAFPIQAEKPSCEPVTIPASTMDPAYNWAEVINPGSFGRDIEFSVFDSLGAVKFQKQYFLAPHSQQHIFLNASLGERAVGSFHVRCLNPNVAAGEGVIVQSAYYGRRVEPNGLEEVDWAYITQGRGGDESTVQLFNTFLGAANWNKFLSLADDNGFVDSKIFATDGSLVKMRSDSLLARGAIDLPKHSDAGYDIYGMSIALSSVGIGTALSSDLLRVFPDSRGGIGYIMNVPPQPLPEPVRSDRQKNPVQGISRRFEVAGTPSVIVGESVTQAWMELGTDFNQEAFLDALQARGVNLFMIWSYIGVDDQLADSRIGYNAPVLWPWFEISGRTTPPYRFSFYTPLGEPLLNPRYFNRLRSLAKAAQARNILLLITIHDGWTKSRFAGHPMNIENGGYIQNNSDYVVLATPGTEMPKQFSELWSFQQKHQYLLERFTEKILEATSDLPNVMYEVMNEGEWYNRQQLDLFLRHFAKFISSRTSRMLIINQNENAIRNYHQESNVQAVAYHFPNWSSTTSAASSFNYYSNLWQSPLTTKPMIFDEPVPGYFGTTPERTASTRLMWGTLLGGAGFVLQDDVSWKYNGQTPIDPMVDRLGYAARFFKDNAIDFGKMQPMGNLSSTGVCLAQEGVEYVVYAQTGTSFSLDLGAATGAFQGRFYNPADGTFHPTPVSLNGPGPQFIDKPDSRDWVFWVRRG